MASVLLPRPAISIEDATQQFDLLFDEYLNEDLAFKTESSVTSDGEAPRSPFLRGEVHLESGRAGEESDEVYIPEEQLGPQRRDQKEAICQVAHELRSLGDQYQQQYGSGLARADKTLTALFTQATALKYETFKNTVESLTTTDRNTADFVFMMCLSSNVVSHVGNVANKAKNYFRRFIGMNYIEAMAEAGGVREYVQQ